MSLSASSFLRAAARLRRSSSRWPSTYPNLHMGLVASTKRNVYISSDPRYSDIQRITAHDPDNWLYPWAIFDAMMKDGKTSEAFAYIFYVRLTKLKLAHEDEARSSPPHGIVLQEMRQHKIPLDSNMLGELISRAIYNNNLELSLRYLYLLRSQNHSPIPIDSVQPIITLAARQNHSRLAIDIALWYDSVGEKLPKSVWTSCLASAATTLYFPD
ncbi:hypothetical protein D9611_000149 [Ephemerocybe angulata]|uniref:Uncharacterized protein n=1 Tax=Ephemerocybe angulata TaxID=980116 RepID=A0A8H5F6J9_9AGAR|nr:hypothetical protein D9611_000149 [Tulosesus angulatus]